MSYYQNKPEEQVKLDDYICDLNLEITNGGYSCAPLSKEGFSYMWGGAKATHGVRTGKVCFEVKISGYNEVSCNDYTDVHVARVGWSTDSATLQLGEDTNSFGFGGTGKKSVGRKFLNYGRRYEKGDVVGCYLSMENGWVEISFSVNGRFCGSAYKIRWMTDEALFPHVLSKNIKMDVNFGQAPHPYFSLQPGYKLIGHIPSELRIPGVRSPVSQANCEVCMMVGLPGVGKSTWAINYAKIHPSKKYTILGTDFIIDKMRVMGLPRKKNFSGRWDVLIKQASDCFNTLLKKASNLPRNLILDQTNVYASARRRKVKQYREKGYIVNAMVLVPRDEDMIRRSEQRTQEEGKEVPETAVLDMKANFSLPTESENLFDAITFLELQREEAAKLVEQYNNEAVAKGHKSNAQRRDGSGRNQSQVERNKRDIFATRSYPPRSENKSEVKPPERKYPKYEGGYGGASGGYGVPPPSAPSVDDHRTNPYDWSANSKPPPSQNVRAPRPPPTRADGHRARPPLPADGPPKPPPLPSYQKQPADDHYPPVKDEYSGSYSSGGAYGNVPQFKEEIPDTKYDNRGDHQQWDHRQNSYAQQDYHSQQSSRGNQEKYSDQWGVKQEPYDSHQSYGGGEQYNQRQGGHHRAAADQYNQSSDHYNSNNEQYGSNSHSYNDQGYNEQQQPQRGYGGDQDSAYDQQQGQDYNSQSYNQQQGYGQTSRHGGSSAVKHSNQRDAAGYGQSYNSSQAYDDGYSQQKHQEYDSSYNYDQQGNSYDTGHVKSEYGYDNGNGNYPTKLEEKYSDSRDISRQSDYPSKHHEGANSYGQQYYNDYQDSAPSHDEASAYHGWNDRKSSAPTPASGQYPTKTEQHWDEEPSQGSYPQQQGRPRPRGPPQTGGRQPSPKHHSDDSYPSNAYPAHLSEDDAKQLEYFDRQMKGGSSSYPPHGSDHRPPPGGPPPPPVMHEPAHQDGYPGRSGPADRYGPPGRDGQHPRRDIPPAPGRDGYPPRRDGVPGRDVPLSRDEPQNREGHPRRDGSLGRNGGPPRRDGPPARDGPMSRDGPPARDGPPRRDGPPGRDGPMSRDGPPRRDGPPPPRDSRGEPVYDRDSGRRGRSPDRRERDSRRDESRDGSRARRDDDRGRDRSSRPSRTDSDRKNRDDSRRDDRRSRRSRSRSPDRRRPRSRSPRRDRSPSRRSGRSDHERSSSRTRKSPERGPPVDGERRPRGSLPRPSSSKEGSEKPSDTLSKLSTVDFVKLKSTLANLRSQAEDAPHPHAAPPRVPGLLVKPEGDIIGSPREKGPPLRGPPQPHPTPDRPSRPHAPRPVGPDGDRRPTPPGMMRGGPRLQGPPRASHLDQHLEEEANHYQGGAPPPSMRGRGGIRPRGAPRPLMVRGGGRGNGVGMRGRGDFRGRPRPMAREMLKRPHEEDPSMLEMNVEGHQEDGPAIPRKTLLATPAGEEDHLMEEYAEEEQLLLQAEEATHHAAPVPRPRMRMPLMRGVAPPRGYPPGMRPRLPPPGMRPRMRLRRPPPPGMRMRHPMMRGRPMMRPRMPM